LDPILEVPTAVDVLEDSAFDDVVEATDEAADTTDSVDATEDATDSTDRVDSTDEVTDSTDGAVDSIDDATEDSGSEVSLGVVQAANIVITITSASKTISTFFFMRMILLLYLRCICTNTGACP